MSEGAPLAGVWPPALSDTLRVAVEADAGERGFSHVAACGTEGPVLLLAPDALVVWNGPGELRRLGYDEAEVGKRMRRWHVGIPAAATDAQPDGQAPDAPAPAPLLFEVSKEVAARVSQLASRARMARDNHVTEALRAVELPAAEVRDRMPAAMLELARPQPSARDQLAPHELGHGTTERAPAAQPRIREPMHGVVASVLRPIGYVRLRSRQVLVPATASADPLAVGQRVTLSDGPDGTLLAHADDARYAAEPSP